VSKTIPIAAAAAVVLLAGVVYITTRPSTHPAAETTTQNVQEIELSVESTAFNNDVTPNHSNQAAATNADDDVAKPNAAQSDGPAADKPSATFAAAIDFAHSLAQVDMDDAAILDAAKKMRQDPALLAAVLDEFASETDPERLRRLRLLLGQLDDLSIVATAESMVYSGNPASTEVALDLLQNISPRVPEAKAVALDILSSTQDTQTIIRATQVIGSPSGSTPETRDRVVGTLSALVQHEDAMVRRGSYSILARWSTDSSVTPTLLQGLSDPNPAVRKSTAYGLVGYPHEDSSVVEALLITAEDANETNRARRGALLALKGMTLDDTQRARMIAAEATL